MIVEMEGRPQQAVQNGSPATGSDEMILGSGPLDLQSVISVVWRRRRTVLAMIMASLVGAIVFHTARPQLYEAAVLVLINAGRDQILPTQKLVSEQTGSDVPAIASEIEILRSREILATVSERLRLDQIPEFNWRAAEKPPAPASPQEIETTVVSALTHKTEVFRRGQSFVLELRARARDPELAARIANTWAETYRASQVAAQRDGADRAKDWLSDRLNELRNEVSAKEAAVEEYRVRSNLLSVQGGSLTEQQIEEIQGSVLAARADLAEREARLRQVRQLGSSGRALDTVGIVLQSSTIASLRARESELDRQLADLRGRYLDEHPAVVTAMAERNQIAQSIQAEIARVSQSLENDVDVARTRLATLESSLLSARQQLATNSDALVRLQELERDAAAPREEYEALLRRVNEVANQRSLQVSDVRVVSPAVKPARPTSLSLWKVLALGLVLGFGLAAAACVVAEMFDDAVKDADDLLNRAGLKPLSVVPQIQTKTLSPAAHIISKPLSVFSEAIRMLRVSICETRREQPIQVLAITSAMPGEGKSTLSACIARDAARSGQRTLLIDCDLRRSSLHTVFDVEPQFTLVDVLEKRLPWRDAIWVDEPSSLYVLFSKSDQSDVAADVFSSSSFEALIADLRTQFDLIICDTAPMLAVADTRLLAARADGVALIARAGKTPARALKICALQLRSAGARMLGAVLNGREKDVLVGRAYKDSLYYYGSPASNYYKS